MLEKSSPKTFKRTATLLLAGLALGLGANHLLQPVEASAGAPSKKAIETENAPAAIGPYSQGIRAGNTIYVSGQLPIDAASGELDVASGIEEQTELSIRNIEAVLAVEGLSLDNVVMSNVYLDDMDDFAKFNEVYEAHFGSDRAPARATVEVARLPKSAKVEISVIATK